MALPSLYTYRRCPYAMRARMALGYSGIAVEMREITLRDKPQHMLQLSPKATVPVLVLENGRVIDESLDIMQWAIAQHDPEQWLAADQTQTAAWIAENDSSFKPALDRYKYASRFPQQPAAAYRREGEVFLQKLEQRLTVSACLFGESRSLADIAIFPFIRQFAMVDVGWFDGSPYPATRAWLERHINSPLFLSVMHKLPTWQESPAAPNRKPRH